MKKDKADTNNQIFPFDNFQHIFSCQMVFHDINLPRKYFLYYFKNQNTEIPTRLYLFYFSQYLNLNLSFNGLYTECYAISGFLLIW